MKVRLCVTLRALALLRCEPRSTNSELPSAGSCPWGPLCLTHPMLGGGGGVLCWSEHCMQPQHPNPSTPSPAPRAQHPKPSTLTTPRLQGAECSKSPPGQKVNPGQSSLGWLHCPPGLNSPFVRGAEGGPRCAAGWAILPQPLIRGEGGCVFYRGIIGVVGDPQGLSLWGAVPSLTSFLWPWTSPFSLLPASFYRCRSRRVIRADERPREERAVLVHARGVSSPEKQESSAEGPCDGGGGAEPHSSFSSKAAVRLAGPGCLPAPPACTAGSERRRGCGCRGARQGGPDGLQAPLPTPAVTDG